MIINLLNFILHIDKYILLLIQNYGTMIYLILFIVVFCETGLVVIPFLPGDSLLFASGAFASLKALDIKLVYMIFILAAVLGDTANYHIGYYIGPKVFNKENSKFLNKKHLEKTKDFYEKHGAVTVVIARFMPIIRTFAPFVAGIGKMNYIKFLSYNLIGGALWVTLFVFTGYYFGNIPFIKENFSIVVYMIILISLMPAVIGFLKTKIKKSEN